MFGHFLPPVRRLAFAFAFARRPVTFQSLSIIPNLFVSSLFYPSRLLLAPSFRSFRLFPIPYLFFLIRVTTPVSFRGTCTLVPSYFPAFLPEQDSPPTLTEVDVDLELPVPAASFSCKIR